MDAFASAAATGAALTAFSPVFTDLTLAERAALERSHDGPIPASAVADQIRRRAGGISIPGRHAGDRLRRHLFRVIAWAQADLDFFQRQHDNLDAEIAALMANRDGLYGGGEKDRITRHIAQLGRQRDAVRESMAPYETIIADARTRLNN